MKRHLKTKIKMALVGFMEIDPFQARYTKIEDSTHKF